MKKNYLLFSIYLVFMLLSNLNAKEKISLTTFKNSGMGHVQQRILKELYTRLGYELEILEMPGRRAINMSNQGLSDGEVARVPMARKKYTNLIMIPVPLHNIKFTAFVTDENKDLKINNFNDLNPYNIVTMRGYLIIENIFKENKKEIKVLNSYRQILLTLKSKRYDIAVLTYLDGLNTLKLNKVKGITGIMPFIDEMPVYHFVHKKNKHLVPILTATLKEMEKEGILKKIENEVIEEFKKYQVE